MLTGWLSWGGEGMGRGGEGEGRGKPMNSLNVVAVSFQAEGSTAGTFFKVVDGVLPLLDCSPVSN